MNAWLDGLVSLFYPNLCQACGRGLAGGERVICTFCLFHLPRTHFRDPMHNPVARHFWGKVKIEGASAFLHFNKGERVSQLIYNLKYRRRKEVGEYIGKLFGGELKSMDNFRDVDAIVPVPLHPSRLRSRGFNQSVCFAAGLAEALDVPVRDGLLERPVKTDSQTRKHRFERWQNVHGVFKLRDRRGAQGKHYLVADDVITTGSTASACAECLLSLPGTRVSVASMAFANR